METKTVAEEPLGGRRASSSDSEAPDEAEKWHSSWREAARREGKSATRGKVGCEGGDFRSAAILQLVGESEQSKECEKRAQEETRVGADLGACSGVAPSGCSSEDSPTSPKCQAGEAAARPQVHLRQVASSSSSSSSSSSPPAATLSLSSDSSSSCSSISISSSICWPPVTSWPQTPPIAHENSLGHNLEGRSRSSLAAQSVAADAQSMEQRFLAMGSRSTKGHWRSSVDSDRRPDEWSEENILQITVNKSSRTNNNNNRHELRPDNSAEICRQQLAATETGATPQGTQEKREPDRAGRWRWARKLQLDQQQLGGHDDEHSQEDRPYCFGLVDDSCLREREKGGGQRETVDMMNSQQGNDNKVVLVDEAPNGKLAEEQGKSARTKAKQLQTNRVAEAGGLRHRARHEHHKAAAIRLANLDRGKSILFSLCRLGLGGVF